MNEELKMMNYLGVSFGRAIRYIFFVSVRVFAKSKSIENTKKDAATIPHAKKMYRIINNGKI